jgi:hypothetical protein
MPAAGGTPVVWRSRNSRPLGLRADRDRIYWTTRTSTTGFLRAYAR